MNDSTLLVDRYIDRMRSIQSVLYELFNKEIQLEPFSNDPIPEQLINLKIQDDRNEFKSFLYFLSINYQNRHQQPENLKLIETILLYYKNDILKYFTNIDIIHIFIKDNKLLLFLIKSEIIKADRFFFTKLDELSQIYFFNEVKDYFGEEKKKEIMSKITENYEQKRQIGENDTYLCEIIRKDLIDDFITFLYETNLPLSSVIKRTFYETNYYLIEKDPKLIEYAAFCGSIRIFNYLLLRNVECSQSIWLYAIHGQNNEIISILEDKIKPRDKLIQKIYKETIKCHFTDVAYYIQNNYFSDDDIKNEENFIHVYLKSHNFEFMKAEFICKSNFLYICKCDYPFFVDFLLKTEDIKIDEIILKKKFIDYAGEVEYEKSPLSMAIENDNNDVVKILLSYNSNIDINHKYRIYQYIINNVLDVAVYALLLAILILFLSIFQSSFLILGLSFLLFTIFILMDIISYSFASSLSIQLLQKICSISISTSTLKVSFYKISLLHMACKNNNAEIVQLLLSNPNIDVNAKHTCISEGCSYIQKTPLFIAINDCNNDEIVEMLLSKRNINVNIAYKKQIPKCLNSDIMNIIFVILIISNIQFLKFFIIGLLSCLIYAYINHNNALLAAIKLYLKWYIVGFLIGLLIRVLFLKSSFESIHGTINRFFNMINRYSFILTIFELLYPLFIYEYDDECSPLTSAIENGNVKIVKLLLSNDNINVNFVNKQIFNEYKDTNCSRYSLKSYTQVFKQITPISCAVLMNEYDITKLLLEHKKIHLYEDYYKTVKRVFFFDNLSILYLFLFLFSTSEKLSALKLAIEDNNVAIVKLLLEKSPVKVIEEAYFFLGNLIKCTSRNIDIDQTKDDDNGQTDDDNNDQTENNNNDRTDNDNNDQTENNNNDRADNDNNMDLDKLNEISELFQKYINY